MKVIRNISGSLIPLLAAAGLAAAPIRVVTTTTDLASIVRSVGGGRVSVENLASPVQDPHFVEAKPSLIVKLIKADLFILNGLELEAGWAPLLVQGSRNPRIQAGTPGYLDASTAIQPIDVPISPDRSGGDVHPGGNPHYMADPENARLVARVVAVRLKALDPAGADDYDAGLAALERRLDEGLKRWKEKLAFAEGARFVSYHKNWNYFARRFGLLLSGEMEPKPGIPPTAAHTAALIERMKLEKVRLILNDPWYESRTPGFVARETGARVVPMGMYPGAYPGTEDYIAAVERNVRLVAEALKGGSAP